MTRLLCPLLKMECKEEGCAWYIKELDKCAIYVIARVLRFDYVSVREEG